MLAIYAISMLFWISFIPFRYQGNTDTLQLLKHHIRHGFLRNDAIKRVDDGNFDADYFALRDKPQISALLIDNHSAVAIKDGASKRGIFFDGLWQLKPQTSVLHVFDLQARTFTLGPDSSHNPFTASGHPSRSMRENQANLIAADRTRCQTSDGVELVPVVAVCYRLISEEPRNKISRRLLAFSAYLEGEGRFGDGSALIESILGAHIAEKLGEAAHEIVWAELEPQAQSHKQLSALIHSRMVGKDIGMRNRIALQPPLLGLLSVTINVVKVWMP